MKKRTLLLGLISIFALMSFGQGTGKYKTIEKSGRRYHWLKWSGGKIYKDAKKARNNDAINKGEAVLYFVVKAEEPYYYKKGNEEYGYKLVDMQDELDFNVSKMIAGMVLSNFESSIDRGTKIGEGTRRTEIHQSIGSLKKNVKISGIMPIKEFYEIVVYKNDKEKKKVIKLARLYSLNKPYLTSVIDKAAEHVGLTPEETNAVKTDLFSNVEEDDIDKQTDENFEW